MEFLELCRAENGDLPESMGWISTHPLGTERIESLERAVAAETDPRPWMSAGEWATFQARYAD
jgi:predicted Zn-dependent protease